MPSLCYFFSSFSRQCSTGECITGELQSVELKKRPNNFVAAGSFYEQVIQWRGCE